MAVVRVTELFQKVVDRFLQFKRIDKSQQQQQQGLVEEDRNVPEKRRNAKLTSVILPQMIT